MDARELIDRNLDLVGFVAAKVHARLPGHVEIEDLMQDGYFGLMDAAGKFDPDRGVKFTTFAPPRIRGAMLDGIRTRDWATRTMRRAARAVDQDLPTHHSLSRKVVDGDSRDVRCIDMLSDETGGAGLAMVEEEDVFEHLIAAAPERCRPVLRGYYGEDQTMRQISLEVGLSESRISQLHTQAMAILKARIEMDGEGNGQVVVTSGRIGHGVLYTCDQIPDRIFTHRQAAEEADVGTQYLHELLRQGKPAGEKKLVFRRVGEEGDGQMPNGERRMPNERHDAASAVAAAEASSGGGGRRGLKCLTCDQIPGRTFTIKEAAAEAGVAFINSRSLNKGWAVGARKLVFRRIDGAAASSPASPRRLPSRRATKAPCARPARARGLTAADLRERLELKRDAEIAAVHARFGQLLASIDLIADVLIET